MSVRPVLYVSVRPEEEAAAAEYDSFRAVAVGRESHRWDLVRRPLEPGVLDDYSLAVIGGSPYNVTDAEADKSDVQRRLERDLESIASHAADRGFPTMFTCYGIGIVTRLLGGTVTKGFGEEPSAAEITLTSAGTRDPLLRGLPRTFSVLTSHKEGAAEPPPGATLLASNDACPTQIYRVSQTLYAAQFHPEPTTLAFAERMTVYRNAGYFQPHEYARLSGAILASPVTEPARFLDRFIREFAD